MTTHDLAARNTPIEQWCMTLLAEVERLRLLCRKGAECLEWAFHMVPSDCAQPVRETGQKLRAACGK